jgi:hypothetical protein
MHGPENVKNVKKVKNNYRVFLRAFKIFVLYKSIEINTKTACHKRCIKEYGILYPVLFCQPSHVF